MVSAAANGAVDLTDWSQDVLESVDDLVKERLKCGELPLSRPPKVSELMELAKCRGNFRRNAMNEGVRWLNDLTDLAPEAAENSIKIFTGIWKCLGIF